MINCAMIKLSVEFVTEFNIIEHAVDPALCINQINASDKINLARIFQKNPCKKKLLAPKYSSLAMR